MTTDASWDSTRWRDAQLHARGESDGSFSHEGPQLSAPTAINPATQSGILHRYENDAYRWDVDTRRPRLPVEPRMAECEQQPPLTEPYLAQASSFRNRPHQRHSPSPGGGNHGPPQLANTSPHQMHAGAWRVLHDDLRHNATNVIDAPLTLDIPRRHVAMMEDLPRIAAATHNAPARKDTAYSKVAAASTNPTSLPSFASFQEQTNRVDDPDVDGPEIAPMASRLSSCSLCDKLRPMVREVAIAVAELDDSVQVSCQKAGIRTFDVPNASDNPMMAVQWILDRLKTAKSDIQDALRSQASYSYEQSHPVITRGSARSFSPPNGLKRQAVWDQDDYAISKRPRSGASQGHPSQATYATAYHLDRRASIDFAPRTMYSPPPTDGAPASAFPRTGSPGPGSRPFRPLPSPASMAYPLSAAASLPPPTVHSASSPVPSYQPSLSIHSGSASSATSAHLADLQHQVTLKSLALQTLQSEYASLLQKLQRERIKSQTIEKKTNVVDQEVNELTSRSEEMAEQIKSLEMQLEESEKKRDIERADAARDKEQWGRMLEMGGRLHSKNAEERQKLVEERDQLLVRIAAYEEENDIRAEQIRQGMMAKMGTAVKPSKSSDRGAGGPTAVATDPGAGSHGKSSSEVTSLKREIVLLKARIETLQSTLQEVGRHSQDLGDRSRDILKYSDAIGSAIDKALGDGHIQETRRRPAASNNAPHEMRQSNLSPTQPKASSSPTVLPTIFPKSVTDSSFRAEAHQKLKGANHPPPVTDDILANATRVGRAVSPGPEELGFHVHHSHSSPEELIKALGPVPAPLPNFPYGDMLAGAQDNPSGPRHGPDYRQNDDSSRGLHFQRTGKERTEGARRGSAITDGNSARSIMHVSPYHHVPSAFTQHGQAVAQSEDSPRSYHSSPGPMRDDLSRSNSAGSAKSASPASNPEADRLQTSKAGVDKSARQLPIPSSPSSGLATFRHWTPDTRHGAVTAAMPPPPRPSGTTTAGGYSSPDRSDRPVA